MPQAVSTQAGDVKRLAVIQTSLKAAGADGPGVLKLYQNDVTPSRDSVAADFTEANFTGYSSLTLTLTVGPYINGAGQPEIQQASKNWTPTDAVAPNTIYGWYMVDAAGVLAIAERFDTPRPMLSPTDSLTLVWSLILLPGGLTCNVQPIDA